MRVPAPGGLKGPDGKPATVLAEGTVLRDGLKAQFLALGGMSAVYRVSQTLLAKEVPAHDPKALLALGQEKSLLERLDHPSIVKAHEMFECDGYYYLVRDFVDGQTLDQQLPARGFLEEKVVLEWALRLCNVLGYLHAQHPPVVYRDLKPKNVIRDENGKLLLFDFGIARSFKEGKSQDTLNLGSALTASPEHYGGQTDARSDIYTLGATLYFLLTGGRGERESPFHFPLVTTVNPEVSGSLAQVIARCVERKPELRYQNTGELAQALLECNAPRTQASAAPPASVSPRWLGVGALLLLALMVALRPRTAPRSVPTVAPAVAVTEAPTTTRTALPPVLEPPAVATMTPAALPTASQTPAAVIRTSVTVAQVIHPKLDTPVYPQSHNTPRDSPTPAPAVAIQLPPMLDAQFFRGERTPVDGRRDATGVWVERPGIRFHLPRGYEQVAELSYVSGQKRTFKTLALRRLEGTASPQDYARLRQAEQEGAMRELTVANRAAVEMTIRRPDGRRLLVCTEIYLTSPDGAGWLLSAGSTRGEHSQLALDLELLLSSWAWD